MLIVSGLHLWFLRNLLIYMFSPKSWHMCVWGVSFKVGYCCIFCLNLIFCLTEEGQVLLLALVWIISLNWSRQREKESLLYPKYKSVTSFWFFLFVPLVVYGITSITITNWIMLFVCGFSNCCSYYFVIVYDMLMPGHFDIIG